MRRLPCFLLCLLPAASCLAGTAYECVDGRGRVSFQDHRCGPGQHQRARLPFAPAAPQPPAAAPAPTPAAPPAPPAAARPAAPTAPLPLLFLCVRATDGKLYVGTDGDPPPYRVPYGILGADGASLADVYGADRGAAGTSAPEQNRGRITPALVAGSYVEVQDACRPMDTEETCQKLRGDYDANEERLRNAFRSQRPPLEKREAELQAQLANCDD